MGDPRFNNPVRPKCSACGKLSDVHAATIPGVIPGTHGGYRWLCASCEYIESHPDAARIDRGGKHDAVQMTIGE